MKLLRRQFSYSYNNAVFILIGINLLIYLLIFITRNSQLIIMLSMRPYDITYQGRFWQFFTYMFIHDPNSIAHVAFNMFALFIFGTQVERNIGSKEFLLYYLLTGTLAGIFSFGVYVYTGNMAVRLMGASGAIFAIQLAYATLFPRSIIYIWGILPLRAPVMVLGFASLEIFFLLTGGRGSVAHMTHLAGFGFGYLYFLLRFGINPWRAMRR